MTQKAAASDGAQSTLIVTLAAHCIPRESRVRGEAHRGVPPDSDGDEAGLTDHGGAGLSDAG